MIEFIFIKYRTDLRHPKREGESIYIYIRNLLFRSGLVRSKPVAVPHKIGLFQAAAGPVLSGPLQSKSAGVSHKNGPFHSMPQPVRSGPVRSGPVRSGPAQSGPVWSGQVRSK